MRKLRMSDPEHIQDRTMKRIAKADLSDFVRAIEVASKRGNFFGDWAVKVVRNRRVIGYAVGTGWNWKTVLSSGQTPLAGSEIKVVQL